MSVFKYHAFIYFLRPPPWYGTLLYSTHRTGILKHFEKGQIRFFFTFAKPHPFSRVTQFRQALARLGITLPCAPATSATGQMRTRAPKQEYFEDLRRKYDNGIFMDSHQMCKITVYLCPSVRLVLKRKLPYTVVFRENYI